MPFLAFLTAPAVFSCKRPRACCGLPTSGFQVYATASAAASGAQEPPAAKPQGPAVDFALSQTVSERLERDSIDKGDVPIAGRSASGTPSSPLLPLPLQNDLLAYHAREAARSRDWRVAERLYRRGLATNKADGRAWLGLARLYMRRGCIDEARKTFYAGAQACRNNPYILQAWGVLEERAGNASRAKGLYQAATRADPKHAPSWVALGLWEQKIGKDYYAARDCFKKGAEGDPTNYYIWHVWGVLERLLGNFISARKCFAAGVAANPRNAATYVVWGVLEEQLLNREHAIYLFEQAHSANPRNVHALVAHAVTLERMGDVDHARRLLDRALSIHRKDAAIYQTYGLLENRMGNLDSAREWFRRGIVANRRHLPVWLSWGVMEEDYGNFNRARQLFQDGIWADPKSSNVVRLWHAWAGLERRDGRIQEARRLFGHGLRAAPQSVAILSGWATMEAEDGGDIAFARDLLDKAVRLQPSQRDLWELYERLEREYGSDSRADAILQRASLCSKQLDHRLIVSDPLPGDYAAGGMWVDTADLDPTNVSGLEVVREKSAELDPRSVSRPLPRQYRDLEVAKVAFAKDTDDRQRISSESSEAEPGMVTSDIDPTE